MTGVPSLSKKKRKGTPGGAVEGEVRVRRAKLAACLASEGSNFATQDAVHQTALQISGELFHLGDAQVLGDLVAACSQHGRGALPALDTLFRSLRSTVGMSERAITFDVYKTVVDHICLSVDTEFSTEALDMLLRYGFAPGISNFTSPDTQEYFVRQQHFLSLELVEEVGTALQSGIHRNCSTPCHVLPARATLTKEGVEWDGNDVLWEVKPHKPWVIPREQFREEAVQASPFKGDILVLVVGTSYVLGVVTEVLNKEDKQMASVVVMIEQAERLGRLMKHTTPVKALVAGSKIAYDRMRTACYELSRKATGIPSMQQWLLLRRPTMRDHEADDEIPKDGRVRLWCLPQGTGPNNVVERWGLECSGAEWCELLLPGMRAGQMVFCHENPYGAEDFDPEVCLGKLVVASRGQCSFADKARNAAASGAAALIVVDSGESADLFCMHRDDRPFVVELPKGKSPGLYLGLRFDGRAVVTEIAPDSPAREAISEGDLIIDIVGAGDLGFEELEELLGTREKLAVPLQVVVRWDRSAPAIPAALISRSDGERLMLAARQGGAQPPVLELHVAEAALANQTAEEIGVPTLSEGLTLNGPQCEAVKAALALQMSGRLGGHVSLIQGPPGTGKTTAALHIIHAWLEADFSREEENERQLRGPLPPGLAETEVAAPRRKVLVTGFSNVAVDNIGIGLQRLGVGPILRVGRGQSMLTEDTLDQHMRRHSAYAELEHLKETSAIGIGARIEAMKLQRRMGHELVAEARVVLCTCISAGGDILAGARFSRVLFDEATQATEPAALVPLLRGCEELVMLGDQKQLPPTTFCHKARTLGLHESLFERLVRLGLPHTMLRVQYRMHPGLAVFPSQAFYSSLLSDGLKPEDRPCPRGYAWPDKTTPLCFEGVGVGGEQLEEVVGTSRRNRREATRLAEIVFKLVAAGDVKADEIAVITPYSAQLSALRNALSRLALPVVPATVDQFQGMERDVVICSAVRSSPAGVGFLSDRRRFNVLLTRARRGLIVLGHQQTLLSDPCWKDWIVHLSLMGLTSGDADSKVSNISTEAAEEERAPGGGPDTWMEFAQGLWPRRPANARITGGRRSNAHGHTQRFQIPGAQPQPKNQALVEGALAPARRMLMESAHTGFQQLGMVPIDFKEEGLPWEKRFTGMLVLVLPGRGTSLARGVGATRIEAEARCCARACELLAEAGLADAATTVMVAARVDDACGPEPAEPPPPSDAEVADLEANAAAAAAVVAATLTAVQPMVPPVEPGLVESAGAAPVVEVRHPKQALIATGLFPQGLPQVQIAQTGPAHQLMFIASMALPQQSTGGGDEGTMVQGMATNKKEAERRCCEKALSVLQSLFPQGFPGVGGGRGGGAKAKRRK